jgi:hypothetical protein
MKNLTIRDLIAVIITIAAGALSAKDANSNAGTSSFSFLKIGVGARAVSLGGAFTGLADDESALYYNPAGIAKDSTDRVMFTYHNYVQDLQSGFLGYIHAVSEKARIGAYVSYLNYGDFVETDVSGNELGTFGGGDFLIGVTYARRQSEKLSIGGSAKFMYEKIQNYSATGIAADLGILYVGQSDVWGVGVSAQNLGFQLSALGEKKEKLPMNFRLGGFFLPRDMDLVLVGDIILPVDNEIGFAIGGEYVQLKPLFLRIGWNSTGKNYRASDSNDKTAGLNFGFGLDYRQWKISYALSPAAELGESHRITLSTGIGK